MCSPRLPLLLLLAALGCVPEPPEGLYECEFVGGPPDGLTLAVARPAWDPARYVFEGSAAGEAFRCELDERREGGCDRASVTLVAHEPSLFFPGHPASVELRVSRAGELLGAGTFEPTYREACRGEVHASAALELEGPSPCGVDGTCRCVHDDHCGCAVDSVPALPWSTCPAGTIPQTACEPSRCACTGSIPVSCSSDCVPYGEDRQRCVDGAFVCPDPAEAADCG